MIVGIVILNYNSFTYLERLIEEIYPLSRFYQIVVVDNCSETHAFNNFKKLLNKEYVKLDLIRSEENVGYFKGNLLGATFLKRRYGAEYALILNPDVGCENWKDLVDYVTPLLKEGYFIIGPKITIPGYNDVSSPILRFTPLTETLFNLTFPISYPLRRFLINRKSNKSNFVFAVEGSAYFIDLNKMIQVASYYDNVFLYGEEIIYGLIAKKKKWLIYYDCSVSIIHYHPPRALGSRYESFYLSTIKEILRLFKYSSFASIALVQSFKYKMMLRWFLSLALNLKNK